MKTLESLAQIKNTRKQKTTQHSNSSTLRKTTAFKLSCRASLQQTPTDSLWKVTKKIKQITKSSPPLRTPQGTWARNNAEKSHAFAKHLEQVFQPSLRKYP
jgi:hypothetical protein